MARTADYVTLFRTLADTLAAFSATPSPEQATSLLDWVGVELKGRILDNEGLEAWIGKLGGVRDTKATRFADDWVAAEQEVFLPSTSIAERKAWYKQEDSKEEAVVNWRPHVSHALTRVNEWKSDDPQALQDIYSDPAVYEYLFPTIGSSLDLKEEDVKEIERHRGPSPFIYFPLGIYMLSGRVSRPDVLAVALTKNARFLSHLLKWLAATGETSIRKTITGHLADPKNRELAVLAKAAFPDMVPS